MSNVISITDRIQPRTQRTFDQSNNQSEIRQAIAKSTELLAKPVSTNQIQSPEEAQQILEKIKQSMSGNGAIALLATKWQDKPYQA
jgi:hypothetical protein